MRAGPVPAPPCPTAGPGHFLRGSGSSVACAAARRGGGFLLQAGALPGRTLPTVGRGTSKLALLLYPTLLRADDVPRSQEGSLYEPGLGMLSLCQGEAACGLPLRGAGMGPAPWHGTGTSPSPVGEECRRTWPGSCWGPKISGRQCHMPGEGSQYWGVERLVSMPCVSIQHRVAPSGASLGHQLCAGLVWEGNSLGQSHCGGPPVVDSCAAVPGLPDCHRPCQISGLALGPSLLLSLPHCQDQPAFCRGGGELYRTVKQNSLNLPLIAAPASFSATS